MEWRDQGVILAVRKHGETGAIVELLTAEHGRCLGLIRGGRSRSQRPVLQPGNFVEAKWRARLEDHLGHFTFEPLQLRAGMIMEEPFRLAGLASLCGLARLLPEREPHRRIYDAFQVVLDAIGDDTVWPALLVRWELGLLEELGFGLDLTACAATGVNEELAFVSPKSGRAVSLGAGGPYREKLLHLPAFLRQGGEATTEDVLNGFRLTGFFLNRHVFEPRGIAAPESREWIIRMLQEKVH